MADVLNDGEAAETPEDVASEVAEFEKELLGTDDDDDRGDVPVVDDPAPEVIPEETSGDEQPPTEQPPEEEKQSEPVQYAIPEDPAYGNFSGKKATAAELEEAGLLDKLITHSNQGLNHVRLYQELKERVDKQDEAQKAAAEEAGAPPPRSSEEFRGDLEKTYLPGLKELAEGGAFEKDFLHAYPGVASHLEHRFQSGAIGLLGTVQQVTSITEKLNMVMEFVGMEQETRGQAAAQTVIDGILDETSKVMPALKDLELRGRFVQWATDPENRITNVMVDKDVESVTVEDAKGAFAAYVAMTGDGLKKKPRPRAGSNMAGSGSASRGSGSPGGVPKGEVAQFEQELMDSY